MVVSQKHVMKYRICMNDFATKKGQVVALFVKGHIIAKPAEISDYLHEIRVCPCVYCVALQPG